MKRILFASIFPLLFCSVSFAQNNILYGNIRETDSAFFYKFSSHPAKAQRVLWLPLRPFIGIIDQKRKWYVSAGEAIDKNDHEIIVIDLRTEKILKKESIYSFYSADSLYRLTGIPYAMEYNPRNGKIYCLSQIGDVQKQTWTISLYILDPEASTITFIDSIPKHSLDLMDLQRGGIDFDARCNAALDYDKGILWLSKNKDHWFSKFHTLIGIDIKTADIVNTVQNDFYGMEYNPFDSLIYGIQDNELQDTVTMGYVELPNKQRTLKKPIPFQDDIFEWSYTFDPETRYFVIQGGIPNKENLHHLRFINFDNGEEIDIPMRWLVYHMRMLADPESLGIETKYSVNQNVLIYPNPVCNQINIPIAQEDLPMTVSVFNAIGQLVMTANSQSESFRLDVSALPQGIYIIYLLSEKKTMSARFIKRGW